MDKVNINPKRYADIMVQFYKCFTGQQAATVEDIPADTLQFMAGMDYWDMLRPVIVRALRAGTPVKPLAAYWGVPSNTVKRLRQVYMLPASK